MPGMSKVIPILALLFSSGGALSQGPPTVEAPPVLRFPGANSRPTYFDTHDIRAAWEISRGADVKVGILDHSFGYGTHEGLYAGGANFQEGEWGASYSGNSHHGFWMASVLREVAPEVEIYALCTYSDDEASKVDAMVRAIDWAIEHDLDVLTYSARRFSEELRPKLDRAVDRALEQGIVTTFIHYPHPGNLLPSWMGGPSGDDERIPDVNILHYDYSVIFTRRYADWLERSVESGYRPFLSVSSTSPVTAGFVAMLKSVAPSLGPQEYRRILVESSRPMVFEGQEASRVVDIAAALRTLTRKLDSRFDFLEPVIGKRWTGRYVPTEPDEQFDHVISWESILDGRAARCTKTVAALDFEMETTYYRNPASDSIVFVSLTNRGQMSSGTVDSEDGRFVLLGSDGGAAAARDSKQTFEVRPDGVLQDRFFLDEGQGWTQGHLIEYVERQEPTR
jgi:hypothetical protein